MSTDSLLLSRRDLEFQLYEWLKVEDLSRAERYAEHNRETFDAVLETCERIATELFEPHYRKSDRDEPRFEAGAARVLPEIKPALQAFAESGLIAAGQDYELGGMQLPTVVEKAGFAYFMAANMATAAYPFLSIGNANLLLAHGSPAQINTFVRPTLEGRFFGTMCLSEPAAGSSLADIKTQASFDCDSPLGPQYRLRGSKMWISGGEQDISDNIVHLVLARECDAEGRSIDGIKGISLYIVPKFLVNADGSLGERNDVALAGLNHKMGYRGTTNCLLAFGEGTEFQPGGKPGAVAYRVGEANCGMAYMFHMMNEARVGVGLSAVALGYTGYLHALDYARNRPQGRKAGAKTAQVPIIQHADVRRMLLAQKAYVEAALGLNLYCARLLDEHRTSESEDVRRELHLLLEILTPIAKSWPAQWCLAANDLAIQVHGGYGYTREYKVEQFYRDNRLNMIHEGTHGIQGLDLLGRKVTMQGGAALQLLVARMLESVARAEATGDGVLGEHAQALRAATMRLVQVTKALWADGDAEAALANASLYLEAFGHIVIAWIWLEQSIAAHGTASDFHDGKRSAARYFFRYELPRVGPQLALLEARDRCTLDLREQCL